MVLCTVTLSMAVNSVAGSGNWTPLECPFSADFSFMISAHAPRWCAFCALPGHFSIGLLLRWCILGLKWVWAVRLPYVFAGDS